MITIYRKPAKFLCYPVKDVVNEPKENWPEWIRKHYEVGTIAVCGKGLIINGEELVGMDDYLSDVGDDRIGVLCPSDQCFTDKEFVWFNEAEMQQLRAIWEQLHHGYKDVIAAELGPQQFALFKAKL